MASELTGLTFDEESHTYRVDGELIPSVNQILDEVVKGEADRKKFMPTSSATRGTFVHAAIAMAIAGTLDWDTLDPQYAAYVQGAMKCLERAEIKPLKVEWRAYSYALWYAGTIDLIGEMKGKTCVFDWKTGQIVRRFSLQTAAYAFIANDNGIGIDERYCVQLDKDGGYSLKRNEDDYDTNVWICMKECYKWNHLHDRKKKAA